MQKLSIPPEEFLTEYGSTLVSLGKADEAITHLKRSLAARPTADAAVSLSQAFLQIGETPQAVTNWELALKLNPVAHRASEGLADVALREGDAQKALEWLSPLEENGTLEPATAYLFQQIYQRLGDQKKAAVWQARTAQLAKAEPSSVRCRATANRSSEFVLGSNRARLSLRGGGELVGSRKCVAAGS